MSKNALNGTENVRKQNLLQIEQKMCMGTKNVQGNTKNVLLWQIMVLNCGVCLVWPYVALYGLMWHLMVLTLLFTAMTMCGLIWISMALCVLVLTCMALFGVIWPLLALKVHFIVFYAEYRLLSRSQIQIHLVFEIFRILI